MSVSVPTVRWLRQEAGLRGPRKRRTPQLPDTGLYFDDFAQTQYDGVRAVLSACRPTLLEDHVLLLRLESEDELAALTYDGFRRGMRDAIIPQFQIARNMGFGTDWRYG